MPDGTWQQTISDLPVYGDTGTAISYAAVENNVNGYSHSGGTVSGNAVSGLSAAFTESYIEVPTVVPTTASTTATTATTAATTAASADDSDADDTDSPKASVKESGSTVVTAVTAGAGEQETTAEDAQKYQSGLMKMHLPLQEMPQPEGSLPEILQTCFLITLLAVSEAACCGGI